MAYDPALYELTHRGNPGDVEFYLRACQGGRSVLELGTGYGRVALALARAGHEVVGLELDPGLLQSAQAAASVAGLCVTLQQGDMTAFELGRRFDRVIIPHSGLYCLLEAKDVLRCLKAARAHLEPDGLLVLDGYAADDFHAESLPEDVPDEQLEPITDVEALGVRYAVFEQSRWDRDAQRIVATYVYLDQATGAEERYALPQRYLLRAELERLLAAAGFSVSLVSGSFEGDAYDEEAEHLIVIAEPTSRSR